MMNFYSNNFNQKKNLLNIGTKLSDFEDNYIVLGKGYYGTVVKKKSKIDNLYYAIKQLDNNKLNLKNCKREIEILANLNHKNIINFYGYFEENNNYYLVFEFAPNGSIKDYIEKYKSNFYPNQAITPFKEDCVINIFKDILNCLKYLHNNNILHRDIKTDNILLDENMTAKITDFGISALYNYNNYNNIINFSNENILFMNNTRIGHRDFISPEIIQGKPYDFKTDIFSLGLTMFYIMSFNLPFTSRKVDDENVERYYNGNVINPFYNIQLRNLVIRMLNDNPDYRPNAFQAYDELILIEQNIKNSQTNQSNQFMNFQNNKNYNFSNNVNNNFQQVQNNQNQYNQNIQNYTNNQNVFNPNYMNNQNINNYNFQNPNIQYNEIKNQNIINNNINKEISQKNYSLLRVIECLYNIKELNLEKIKTIISPYIKNNNNFIPLEIINLIELIGLKFLNKIDKNTFFNRINDLRIKLSLYFEKKNDKNKKIEPSYILKEIFKNFNEEFKNSKISWKNKIFNKIVEIEDLPQKLFPEMYEKIKKFKNGYKNPFIDIFYYVSLNLIKCPDCQNISNVDVQFNYLINIASKSQDNITNIIKNYMKENAKDNCKCSTCFYRGPGENEKKFYISPKFLIINFEDNNKLKNSFEEIIDLSSYILTDIGPKKYILFALIKKENNEKYISFIKNEKSWYFCSSEDTIEECDIDSINYGIPSMVIYKGFD